MAIDLKTYEALREKTSFETAKTGNSVLELLNKDIKIFKPKISDKTKEQFYSHLFLLLSAGVDIKQSLELFEQARKKKFEKHIFASLREKVINGSSLSGAMQKESNYFSEYERFGIMIGEESGQINEVLNEQAQFFAKKIKQKRQLISVLTYPAVVLSVAIGAVFFMMKFMVPMFSDVFKRFGGDLPRLTKIVISISNWFSDYGYLTLIIIIALIVFFASQTKKEWFRNIGSRIVFKIPVLNQLITKIYLTRFCQAMNLLLSSKTPIVKAINLAKNMVGFYPIEKSLSKAADEVLRGESLYKSLSQFPVYNSSMLALIKAAEEVNRVDVIFGKLAKQYSEEVEQQSDIFGKLMEPVIMIVIGILVTIILLAMYIPLFQLSTTVH